MQSLDYTTHYVQHIKRLESVSTKTFSIVVVVVHQEDIHIIIKADAQNDNIKA